MDGLPMKHKVMSTIEAVVVKQPAVERLCPHVTGGPMACASC